MTEFSYMEGGKVNFGGEGKTNGRKQSDQRAESRARIERRVVAPRSQSWELCASSQAGGRWIVFWNSTVYEAKFSSTFIHFMS